MANGTFNVIHVTEQLLKAYGIPWDLAPEEIRAAHATVDAAQLVHVNAVDAVSDAEMGIPEAQAGWDLDAKDAVRAGKALPSRDPLDRARIAHEVAQEDERIARRDAQNAVGALAALLHDDNVRDSWISAIGAHLDDVNDALNTHASTIAPLVSEAVVGASTSVYLGEWLSHPGLPGVQSADPVGALRAVAGMRRYSAANAGNITA